MIKKYKIIVTVVIYLVGFFYMFTPAPNVPDLSNSTRSDESGDTWQHPDQKAFYTNMTRSQVISEIQTKFSNSTLGSLFSSYRLNYPPEESYSLVRDQVPASYLEEIVYPMHSSLFVNGWEPQNAPAYSQLPPESKPKAMYKNNNYLSKVTLRPVYSHIWSRLLIWTLAMPTAYLAFRSFKHSLFDG